MIIRSLVGPLEGVAANLRQRANSSPQSRRLPLFASTTATSSTAEAVEGYVGVVYQALALFNSESEANMRARASPSVMGLIPPSSLLPTQAAQLANSHLRGFHESSWNRLGMSVVRGQVSVSESYVLGMRALGLRGRLARFNPRWDQPTAVPVRPPPPDAAQVPASVWSISAALLLVQPLDVGMGTMFQRLRSFPADGVSLGPPRP